MSKAKAMGTAVESAAASWLHLNGFPSAERLALAGANDRGDIRLQRYPTIIAECKRAQRGVQLGPWMREVEIEKANANARFGLLIAKQAGVGDRRVGRWVTAMHFEDFYYLLARSNTLRREAADGPLFETVDWSPMKINSGYVPLLSGARTQPRSWQNSRPLVPFATTYMTGDRGTRFAVGPLKQFTTMLQELGYGERTSQP